MPTCSHSPKAVAQARMTEVLTSYMNSLMEQQRTTAGQTEGGIPLPLEQYPSFDFFCAEREPPFSIGRYVERLVSYMSCSPEAFIYAMAYLRRLLYRGCPVHSRCIHRLLLCSVVVAAKMRDDHYYSMQYYAQVGGVSTADLNGMEIRFLRDMIDFSAEVSSAEYREVIMAMTAAVSHKHHGSSGNLSDMTTSPCDMSRSSTPVDEPAAAPQAAMPAWAVECQVFW